MAYAISFMMLAQLGGIAFGLAIAGAVFINDAVTNLSAVLPDATREQLQFALAGTSGHYLSSLGEEVRAKATDAIVRALGKVFVPVYVGAAVCLVLSVMFTVCGFFPLFRVWLCLPAIPQEWEEFPIKKLTWMWIQTRKMFKDTVAIAM